MSRTKEEAFRVGAEIAAQVCVANCAKLVLCARILQARQQVPCLCVAIGAGFEHFCPPAIRSLNQPRTTTLTLQ